MSDESTADEAAAKRRKRTYVGLAMIAFGVIGAIVSYFQDKASLDIIRMMEAKDFAILHLVIWTIAGLCFIAWANRSPDDGNDFDNLSSPNS